MTSEDSSDQILQLTFDLSRLLRKQAIAHADRDHCGPNMLQLHTLAMIQEHEGITMSKIASFMRVASPSATSFISRLVKLGWLARAADPENRKLVRLKVTDAGRAALKEQMEMKRQLFRHLMHTIPVDDQRELARILQIVLDSIQKSATL